MGIFRSVYRLAEGLIQLAWQRTLNGERQVTPWPWADTWPVARLDSPRLGVSRLVLHGDSGSTLAFGPGWAEQSAPPGAAGRSFLSAHRVPILVFSRTCRSAIFSNFMMSMADKQTIGWLSTKWLIAGQGGGFPCRVPRNCY
ncbi:MAG: hypothetical protein P8163_04805 [Candidatus Thiodiazotropha sp.]